LAEVAGKSLQPYGDGHDVKIMCQQINARWHRPPETSTGGNVHDIYGSVERRQAARRNGRTA
jgi:hypothetical protein